MEEYENSLHFALPKHNLQKVSGLKLIKVNNISMIWLWSDNKLVVHESSVGLLDVYDLQNNSSQFESQCFNLTLKDNIISVFHWLNDDICYILDSSGSLYSVQIPPNFKKDSMEHMEVEEAKDMFKTPELSDFESKWKVNLMMKVKDCDKVTSACQLSNGIALLAKVEEQLFSFVYSVPELDLKMSLDLEHYNFLNNLNTFNNEVVSSCAVQSLSSSLKQNFKNHLEVLDKEIVIVGLASGLVLWFCTNKPNQGPFTLCSLYQQVQGIYWTKDTNSGLYTHLTIILTSGRIVIFGQAKSFSSCLPDKVKTSCCLQRYFISSNFIDCFASELLINKEGVPNLNCVSLPLKGVCALSAIPHSNNLLAATIHGPVYIFKLTVAPSTTSSLFIIPDQNLLDNMLIQTQNLEKIYKLLSEEDSIIRAISTAMTAKNSSDIFDTTVKILSGNECMITTKLKKSTLVFNRDLWMVCVEILDCQGQRKTSFRKINDDFSSSFDINLKISHSLHIGEVVSVELCLFLEKQQPVISVPVSEIEIDACHLMVLRASQQHDKTSSQSLEKILQSLNKEAPIKETRECKQFLKLKKTNKPFLLLKSILQESCNQISDEEWNKLSGGQTHNIQVTINNINVHFNCDTESNEIIISSSDVHLCHKVKEAILKRHASSENKHLPESIVSEFQALQQNFDIEKLRDKLNTSYLDTIRRKIRSLISSQLTT